MSKLQKQKTKTKTEFKTKQENSSVNENAPAAMENPLETNKQSPQNKLANMAKDGADPIELDFSDISEDFKDSLPIAMQSMSPEVLKVYYDLKNQKGQAFSNENMEFYNREKAKWITKFKHKSNLAREVEKDSLSKVVKDLREHINLFPSNEYKNLRAAAIEFEEYTRNIKELDIAEYSSKFSSTMEAVTRYIDTHANAKTKWGKRRLNMAKSIRSSMEYLMDPVTFFAGRFEEYGVKMKHVVFSTPDYLDIAKNESDLTKVVSDNIGMPINVEKIIEKNSIIDAVTSGLKLRSGQRVLAKALSDDIRSATNNKHYKHVKNEQVVKSMVLSVFNSKIKEAKEELSDLDNKKEEAQKNSDERLLVLEETAKTAKEKYEKRKNEKKEASNKYQEIKREKNSEAYKNFKENKKSAIKGLRLKSKNLLNKNKMLEQKIEDIKSEESKYNRKIIKLIQEFEDTEKIFVATFLDEYIKELENKIKLYERYNKEKKGLRGKEARRLAQTKHDLSTYKKIENLINERETAIENAIYEIGMHDKEISKIDHAIKDLKAEIDNYKGLNVLKNELDKARIMEAKARLTYKKSEQEVKIHNNRLPVLDTLIENKDKFNDDVNKLSLINDAVAHFFNASEEKKIDKDTNVKINGYKKIMANISDSLFDENIFKTNLMTMIHNFAAGNQEKYGVNFTEDDETTVKKITDAVWSLYNDILKATRR